VPASPSNWIVALPTEPELPLPAGPPAPQQARRRSPHTSAVSSALAGLAVARIARSSLAQMVERSMDGQFAELPVFWFPGHLVRCLCVCGSQIQGPGDQVQWTILRLFVELSDVFTENADTYEQSAADYANGYQ
jgi:hypothetical protein